MRKTKIVCTIGPASESPEMCRELILAGMDVARLNFSHGTHKDHLVRLNTLKKLRREMKRPLAILLDTKGPEIRLKTFKGGSATLEENAIFTLTTTEVEGSSDIASVTYKNLPRDVQKGSTIMLDDGMIELSVVSIDGENIACRVINGGVISNSKSINLPGTNLSMPYMNEKDKSDILFGINEGVDYIAASFTRTAEDISLIKKLLKENNASHIKIIAKIESAQGIANADEIINVSDGIMVARGDMGVEVSFDELPYIQKSLIKKCYMSGKMVITATQMLESMMKNPRPTRAETSDVANAVYDGTSAVMLSGESAAGKYPLESVKTMVSIITKTEANIHYWKRFKALETDISSVTDAIAHATCSTAHDLNAKAIIVLTQSGSTARFVSKFRPETPIVAATTSYRTYNQLALSWGVQPIKAEVQYSTDMLFEHVVALAEYHNFAQTGDIVVITGGMPLGVSGTTNSIKVDIVGNILVRGTGINTSATSGMLCVCESEEEAHKKFHAGDILVISKTSNNIVPLLRNASAVITEQDGADSHAAVVGLTLEIPVIIGAANATKILKSGTSVTVDPIRGIVYHGSNT